MCHEAQRFYLVPTFYNQRFFRNFPFYKRLGTDLFLHLISYWWSTYFSRAFKMRLTVGIPTKYFWLLI